MPCKSKKISAKKVGDYQPRFAHKKNPICHPNKPTLVFWLCLITDSEMLGKHGLIVDMVVDPERWQLDMSLIMLHTTGDLRYLSMSAIVVFGLFLYL